MSTYEYKKERYKHISVQVSNKFHENLTQFVKDNGMSVGEYVKNLIKNDMFKHGYTESDFK